MNAELTRVDFAGTRVAPCRWDPAGRPRAIVQITHGMGEHALRYAPLARPFGTRSSTT
jgi:alpha-beta hydrolase superfamily lysophospholipase